MKNAMERMMAVMERRMERIEEVERWSGKERIDTYGVALFAYDFVEEIEPEYDYVNEEYIDDVYSSAYGWYDDFTASLESRSIDAEFCLNFNGCLIPCNNGKDEGENMVCTETLYNSQLYYIPLSIDTAEKTCDEILEEIKKFDLPDDFPARDRIVHIIGVDYKYYD